MADVDYPILILLGGFIAVLGVTARVWDTRPRLRGLPIAYGIVMGLVNAYSKGGLAWQILEGVGAGVLIGLVGIFGIWIEGRARR